MTIKLGFNFKFFVSAIYKIDYFMWNLGNFLDPFDNFYFNRNYRWLILINWVWDITV